MQDLKWTIKVARDNDAELWWLFSSDGHKFCIGEYPEVEALHAKLSELVGQGNHDGEIDADDERIAEWLTVKEAAEMSGVKAVSIRWACRPENKKIVDAKPHPWRFTKSAFLAWVATRNKRHTK